jgi:hypothetical protein
MRKFKDLGLQAQYDAIHSYFKTTTEPYDEIDWDGEVCSNEKNRRWKLLIIHYCIY